MANGTFGTSHLSAGRPIIALRVQAGEEERKKAQRKRGTGTALHLGLLGYGLSYHIYSWASYNP